VRRTAVPSQSHHRPGGAAGSARPPLHALGLPGSPGWLSRVAAHGPDARAEIVGQLQRGAGNRALLRAGMGDVHLAEANAERLIAAALELQLGGTVGKGGENRADDVQAVSTRLTSLGYPPAGASAEDLGAAIARFQSEEAHVRPDGRVDPGGRTLRALNRGVAPAPAPVQVTAPAPAPAAVPADSPLLQLPTDASGPLGAAYAAIAAARKAAAEADTAWRKVDADATKAAWEAEDAAIAALPEPAKGKKKPKAKHKAVNVTDQQELGPSRDALVAALRSARAAVDGLTAQSTGLDPDAFVKARSAMYRELARLAPYYRQQANADILHKGEGKAYTVAGERTCNVTSLSMTLEALGITAADFHGPEAPLLPILKDHFHEPLGKAFDVVSTDLSGYRVPELLQLLAVAKGIGIRNADKKNAGDQVGIDTATSDPEKFAKVVEEGRALAAGKVTNSSWFDELVRDFDVHVSNVYPFEGKASGGVGWADIVDRWADVQKAVKNARRAQKKKLGHDLTPEEQAAVDAGQLDAFQDAPIAAAEKTIAGAPTQLADLKAKLDAATTKKDKNAISAQMRKLETAVKSATATRDAETALKGTGVNAAAIADDTAALERLVPLEQYAAIVSAALSEHLDKGEQIVGHMVGHFFRVEDVKPEGVVCDDPYFGKNKLRTWEECRRIAAFTRFSVVRR
jgi:hypothetical protein